MTGGTLPDRLLLGGLMSGTSLDGVDAVLLEVEGTEPGALSWEVRAFLTLPYTVERRTLVLEVLQEGGVEAVCHLHTALAEWFAEAALALLDEAGVEPGEVAALGSHGQTVWHTPPVEGRRGSTLQLGDPATLAERTGIAVVSDFRARDMAAGGHGAPLVPWADRVLFGKEGRGRALQNLGGMGNVTFLPGDDSAVVAFDTGPGVALIDGAVRMATGGRAAFDEDGVRARRGTVREELLERLLADPFFATPPPRSTGRERFGELRLLEIVNGVNPRGEAEWDDLIATLTALTAASVARAYRDFLPLARVDEVVLTGGGARNPVLVEGIRRALAASPDAGPPEGGTIPVKVGTEALGMDPDAREAAAFALLAWAHLRGLPGTLAGSTGASGPRVLGSFTPSTRETP